MIEDLSGPCQHSLHAISLFHVVKIDQTKLIGVSQPTNPARRMPSDSTSWDVDTNNVLSNNHDCQIYQDNPELSKSSETSEWLKSSEVAVFSKLVRFFQGRLKHHMLIILVPLDRAYRFDCLIRRERECS